MFYTLVFHRKCLWHVAKTLNLSDIFSKGMCRGTSSPP